MRRRRAIALIGSFLAVWVPRFAAGTQEDTETPIRAFDIPTLESLAREMHAQDALAWKATDALVAHRTESGIKADGVKGWITATRDGRPVVRFVRIGDHGPEALYDIGFAESGEAVFSTPTDRTLAPEEIAQYDARALALGHIEKRCSDRYNTVALRDPESDGWLVWALAATLDPQLIIIGGHYRFTISPDGKVVRSRDALSTSCMRFAKRKPRSGDLVSHVVSLTPVETHAFASLSHGKTFHVGTEDGRAWRVDAGRIVRIEQDAAGEDGYAARALAGMAEECTLFTSRKGEAKKNDPMEPTGSTKVIEASEQTTKFSVKDPPDARVRAIGCKRQDIVPSPNDYKVAAAGYPLFIVDNGKGHRFRHGILFLENGRFDFQIIDGEPLTEELAKHVNDRLDAFQRTIQSRH